MASFTYERMVAAPPETIFAVLTDHRRYASITPLRGSALEREGEAAPNGLGAIRLLRAGGPPLRRGAEPRPSGPAGAHLPSPAGRPLREEVIAYEPPTRFAYKLLSGAPL